MIFAGVASIPSRRLLLYRMLDSLLPQVDRIGVFLNEYEEVPEFLVNPKIEVARSQEQGVLGDAGKFFWQAEDYYLACDDDLLYPDGYARKLLEAIERYRRRAICSFHGSLYGIGAVTPFQREVFPCLGSVRVDLSVHSVGTGVMGYHADTCLLSPDIFEHPNMADVWLAAWAQRQEIPLVVLAHREAPVVDLDPADTIWDHSLKRTGSAMDTYAEQCALVRSLDWQTFPPTRVEA